VLIHTPGPSWTRGVPFPEQRGIADHVRYMREQLEKGSIVMGGLRAQPYFASSTLILSVASGATS
jgi:hypothetical protein